jgi:hypothetical protein
VWRRMGGCSPSPGVVCARVDEGNGGIHWRCVRCSKHLSAERFDPRTRINEAGGSSLSARVLINPDEPRPIRSQDDRVGGG